MVTVTSQTLVITEIDTALLRHLFSRSNGGHFGVITDLRRSIVVGMRARMQETSQVSIAEIAPQPRERKLIAKDQHDVS